MTARSGGRYVRDSKVAAKRQGGTEYRPLATEHVEASAEDDVAKGAKASPSAADTGKGAAK